MDILKNELLQSLQTGFIDHSIHSNKEYIPELLVNDKTSGKKVLTSFTRQLRSCDEFWFSTAFITSSGIATLINTFKDLELRGIKGKVLVSQYLNFTQPEALKRILQFKNIELRIMTEGDFHSKGYLFKRGELYDLIIGSSNLTADALCSNKEWNLKISATPISDIIQKSIKEFSNEFNNALPVTEEFISAYNEIYRKQIEYFKQIENNTTLSPQKNTTPNSMQREALKNLEILRSKKISKALLISATGTGKTYLSAFDARNFNTKSLLFIVHRSNIASAAMRTFQNVFREKRTMCLFNGENKITNSEFVFSTIQTLSKEKNLKKFNKDQFDYIIIDESHRAGAESYQKIFDYFKPKFLLGMTATPERTDGYDLFKLFDYNIAYEIRLHRAMNEDMLCPFHYYGVSEIIVNGKLLDDKTDFKHLISSERINHIIEKAKFYGCDSGKVRGLVFCSLVDECIALSTEFNKRGYKTIALTGQSSEDERSNAINLLESDDELEKIDYIFTRDIFNEGIDIPKVNQVIMLRPTQSAIIFVQQLGRGLRKSENKEYLTVIDFIGNYSNNYLVPIALYGDTSYNKDTLRQLLSSESSIIPGSSTINFEKITRERIFQAIDSANMQRKKDLADDYKLLKFKIGKIPMMMDFLEHGSRDPQLYVEYAKSYFNFAEDQEDEFKGKLSSIQKKLLELFSNEINNSIRVEESIILKELIQNNQCTYESISKLIKSKYKYRLSRDTYNSAIKNLNFEFVTEPENKKLVTAKSKYNLEVTKSNQQITSFSLSFKSHLRNDIFLKFLEDNIEYSISSFDSKFDPSKYFGGFILYRKYSRKDVFRVLNWSTNPVAQNVGGYIISPDKSNCPIFVTYHKEDHISNSTKYDDRFINNSEFLWMSKSKRTLESPDVKAIINYKNGLRLPLFIKKHDGEGSDFYYMGDVTPIENTFEQTSMKDDNGKKISVVRVLFSLNNPVEDSLYNYITNS